MKQVKKLLSLALVLVMVFAMSANVFAALDNSASYIVGSGVSSAVTVTVTVQGLDIPYQRYQVVVPAKTAGVQYVADAMVAMNNASTIPVVFGVGTGSAFQSTTANSNYFDHIHYTGNSSDIYSGGSGQGYSGWVFRVNDKFPLETTGWGASINTTPIHSGDVISFYVDNPISSADAARYTYLSRMK